MDYLLDEKINELNMLEKEQFISDETFK